MYNIYQLKLYPILNILTFGCRFPCRADNAAYPHDGRADKRRYRHDRRADSQCPSNVYFFFISPHLFEVLSTNIIIHKKIGSLIRETIVSRR